MSHTIAILPSSNQELVEFVSLYQRLSLAGLGVGTFQLHIADNIENAKLKVPKIAPYIDSLPFFITLPSACSLRKEPLEADIMQGVSDISKITAWLGTGSQRQPKPIPKLAPPKPIMLAIFNDSHESRMFKKKLLPSLQQAIQEDGRVHFYSHDTNSDGFITGWERCPPKEIYEWLAWCPFFAIFTPDSYNGKGELQGSVFRGIRDDYWANEYKISPDPNSPSRYTERDIIAWYKRELATNPIFTGTTPQPLRKSRNIEEASKPSKIPTLSSQQDKTTLPSLTPNPNIITRNLLEGFMNGVYPKNPDNSIEKIGDMLTRVLNNE